MLQRNKFTTVEERTKINLAVFTLATKNESIFYTTNTIEALHAIITPIVITSKWSGSLLLLFVYGLHGHVTDKHARNF